jgi:death on curing protein
MKDAFELWHPKVEQVLDLQHSTLVKHGGDPGLRDHGLLMSALAMPRQTYGGELLHPGPAEMAAAYLFHLCMNHPFVDGNKRIGALVALLFLEANEYSLDADETDLEEMTLRVASSQCSKGELTQWFKVHVRQD